MSNITLGLSNATQKQAFEQMRDRWGAWFPALRDRVAFVRQCANLWQVKAWMHQHIVDLLGGHGDVLNSMQKATA